jgi:hypothetical protein
MLRAAASCAGACFGVPASIAMQRQMIWRWFNALELPQ